MQCRGSVNYTVCFGFLQTWTETQFPLQQCKSHKAVFACFFKATLSCCHILICFSHLTRITMKPTSEVLRAQYSGVCEIFQPHSITRVFSSIFHYWIFSSISSSPPPPSAPAALSPLLPSLLLPSPLLPSLQPFWLGCHHQSLHSL